MAMMLVLETLTPTERAVFELREVFALGYDEIARAVGESVAAVHRIGHRARAHVAARRPRGKVSAAETRAALGAFRRAVETGDLGELLGLRAPDVVAVSDGGGVEQAMPRPVVGAGPVARALAAGLRVWAGATLEPTLINGRPALLVRVGGEIDLVVAMRIDDGRITGIYSVRTIRRSRRAWSGGPR